jgi:hypothetical protein
VAVHSAPAVTIAEAGAIMVMVTVMARVAVDAGAVRGGMAATIVSALLTQFPVHQLSGVRVTAAVPTHPATQH